MQVQDFLPNVWVREGPLNLLMMLLGTHTTRWCQMTTWVSTERIQWKVESRGVLPRYMVMFDIYLATLVICHFTDCTLYKSQSTHYSIISSSIGTGMGNFIGNHIWKKQINKEIIQITRKMLNISSDNQSANSIYRHVNICIISSYLHFWYLSTFMDRIFFLIL